MGKLKIFMLRTLAMEFHDGGHVPSLDSVQHVMSDGEKEDALCGHCEKLALAFGLLYAPQGTSIRISKHLRMCPICHSDIEFISKAEKREIIIVDTRCVHRFQDGLCGCNMYTNGKL